MPDSDNDTDSKKDQEKFSWSAIGLTRGVVFTIVLVIIAVGGYVSRFYIRYAVRHILPYIATNFMMVLYILGGSILMIGIVWYLANNMRKVEGEDEPNRPADSSSTDEGESVTKYFKAKWQKIWTERKELAGWFLGLYVLLNLVMAIFFLTPYRFLWSVPGFLPMQVAVIGILAILTLFDEYKVLKAMAIVIVAIAVIGYSRNLFLVFQKKHPKVASVAKIEFKENQPRCGDYLVITATNAGSPETIMPPGCFYSSEPIEPRNAVYEVITPTDSFTSRPNEHHSIKWVPRVRYRATSDSVVKIAISLTPLKR